MLNQVGSSKAISAYYQQTKQEIPVQSSGSNSQVGTISNHSIKQPIDAKINPVGDSGTRNIAKFITGDQARLDVLSETYDDKTLKQMGVVECATCASRTYVDGSNDPGVSFKTPTHVSPGQSLQAVVGHEMEHVSREQSSARNQGGEVISQSVSIQMSTCAECGKSYASGGLTRTTMSIPTKQQNIETGQLVDMKL